MGEATWAWRHLLSSAHRIAFFLAMTVLAASAAGWADVQWAWVQEVQGLSFAVPPSTAHAVVMVLGFFPLFIAGFAFTAVPRWLQLAPVAARRVAVPLGLQAAGWWLWMAGTLAGWPLALAGLLCAVAGLGATALSYASLVRRSRAPDRLHAALIALWLALGALALAGVTASLLLEEPVWLRACVRSAMWASVVPVFLTASHRMFPALGPVAPRVLRAWGDNWLLALLLVASGGEAVAVWLAPQGWASRTWLLGVAAAEVAGGMALLGAMASWVREQGVKARMAGMLQAGLLWLSLGWLALGAAHGAEVFGDLVGTLPQAWPVAALHALAMGGLGSLMLATVTRVSCVGTGRTRMVDAILWTLFALLQAATVLRVAAALVPYSVAGILLAAAASLWAAATLAWAVRSARWYGQPPASAQPRCATPTLEKPPST